MSRLLGWWGRLLAVLKIEVPPSPEFMGVGVPLSEAFEADNRLKILRGVKLAILYALVFSPSFIPLDLYYVAPEALPRVLWIRFYLELVLLALFFVSLRQGAARWCVHLGLLAVYVAGMSMALMTLMFAPYYAGVNLVIIGSVLIPWGFTPTFLAGSGLWLSYLVSHLLTDSVPPEFRSTFVANNFFMAGSALVATGVNWYAHNLRFDAFRARFQQNRAYNELALANEALNRAKERLEHQNHDLAEAYRLVEDQKKELEQVHARLEEQFRFKSRFLDNMSHELRTPLTLIMTPVNKLLAGNVQGELRKILKGIHLAAGQLLELINDLLDVSKYENRAFKLNLHEANPVLIVEDMVDAWTYTVQDKKLELKVEADPDLPIMWLDAKEFGKVVRNLVSNAVKFTPMGGRIVVRLKSVGGMLELSVQDNGPGIPFEAQEKLFRPFVQVDASHTRQHQGTGLGLALVKHIATLHGGTVSLESQEGLGTTVIARFPIEHPEAVDASTDMRTDIRSTAAPLTAINIEPWEVNAEMETVGDSTAESDISEVLPGYRKQRVLVVEDNPQLNQMLRDLLSRRYVVATANDGMEGLERIRNSPPDLVLSDIMMPRMSGVQLLEEVRKDIAFERLPFILLTAKADSGDRVHGLRAGANDYITKPFQAEELMARVHNLLKLRAFEEHLSKHNRELMGHTENLQGQLRQLFMNAIGTLVAAIDCKDKYTAGHSERVAWFAMILAEPFKFNPEDLHTLELGALLHDIGKIGIPDGVLNKPGKLTAEEKRIIMRHPLFTDQILSRAPELDAVRRVAVYHHEQLDGNGYPFGLDGTSIPFMSRIVSVADVWDALVSDRIYRRGMEPARALHIIKDMSGTHLDPRVVEVLDGTWERLVPPPHLTPFKWDEAWGLGPDGPEGPEGPPRPSQTNPLSAQMLDCAGEVLARRAS